MAKAPKFTPILLREGDDAVEAVNRAQQRLAEVLDELQSSPLAGAGLVTLEVEASGTEKIAHGLGRPPRAVLVTPTGSVTVTDAQANNPRPARTYWLTFSGAVDCKVLFLP